MTETFFPEGMPLPGPEPDSPDEYFWEPPACVATGRGRHLTFVFRQGA